jgi:hypothetical protein
MAFQPAGLPPTNYISLWRRQVWVPRVSQSTLLSPIFSLLRVSCDDTVGQGGAASRAGPHGRRRTALAPADVRHATQNRPPPSIHLPQNPRPRRPIRSHPRSTLDRAAAQGNCPQICRLHQTCPLIASSSCFGISTSPCRWECGEPWLQSVRGEWLPLPRQSDCNHWVARRGSSRINPRWR